MKSALAIQFLPLGEGTGTRDINDGVRQRSRAGGCRIPDRWVRIDFMGKKRLEKPPSQGQTSENGWEANNIWVY